MNDNDISDKRISKDFKGITFSNYKKSEFRKIRKGWKATFKFH